MTVLKILTYALMSSWSLVSSKWEHVKRKMHPYYWRIFFWAHFPPPRGVTRGVTRPRVTRWGEGEGILAGGRTDQWKVVKVVLADLKRKGGHHQHRHQELKSKWGKITSVAQHTCYQQKFRWPAREMFLPEARHTRSTAWADCFVACQRGEDVSNKFQDQEW